MDHVLQGSYLMFYRSLLVGATLVTALPAQAQIVHNNDVVIIGSLCVGFDCAAGVGFGFDTIRMVENNTRLDFTDTSNTASFPTQDWQLVANESSNGGLNAFWIQSDQPTGAGNRVFVVEAGARNNALYVENSGEVGIGTNNPFADVHIRIGDTPTVRLEQDGSAGFTPQTWDVAGNETNWFVRDATTGSRLPLRIRPGASTSSIDIDGDGNVRIGHANTAEANLHVRGSGTRLVLLESSNNGAVQYRLKSDSGANDNSRRIVALDSDNNVESQIVLGDGTVRIAGATDGTDLFATFSAAGLVTTTTGGTCNPGPCDGTFDPAIYEVESIEEHAAFMWENKYLWGVGPTIEGEPMNLTQKTAGILHELEKAHIYIAELNRRIARLEALLEDTGE